jgi:hypothetical protein
MTTDAIRPGRFDLDLSRIEKLSSRRHTAWRMSRDADYLERARHAVDDHWDGIPYEARLQLVVAAEAMWDQINHPQEHRSWRAAIAAPFVVAWMLITKEDFVTRYALAMAGFMIAVKDRVQYEKALNEATWSDVKRDDPEFVAAHERGSEAARNGGFIPVDWDRISLTSS